MHRITLLSKKWASWSLQSGIPTRAPNATRLEYLLRIVLLDDLDLDGFVFRLCHNRHYHLFDLHDTRAILLECLLLSALGLWRNLEALLGRVQDVLDLLE